MRHSGIIVKLEPRSEFKLGGRAGGDKLAIVGTSKQYEDST
jgi:hypothetical protein